MKAAWPPSWAMPARVLGAAATARFQTRTHGGIQPLGLGFHPTRAMAAFVELVVFRGKVVALNEEQSDDALPMPDDHREPC